jgi:hypothetical protein
MNDLKGYKLSGKGQVSNYGSMNPGFTSVANQAVLNPRIVSDTGRLPDAPGLAINTDFRTAQQKPLPRVPAPYMYNYGFPASKPTVSSMTGMIPQFGTPLSKIGKESYPILQPAPLYVNLAMGC